MGTISAKELREKAQEYVDSLRYQCVIVEKRPILVDDGCGHMIAQLDNYGHVMMEYYTPTDAAGEPLKETKWRSVPGVAGLCDYLGIDRTTLWRWCRIDPDDPDGKRRKRGEAARRARTMIEALLEQMSGSRGTLESLRRNFWTADLTRQTEPENTEREERMTMDEMLEELQAMGLRFGEGDEEE